MAASSSRSFSRWSSLRGWAIGAGVAGLLGCSPMCLLQTKFRSPAGVTLDPARLFVTGAKACPPAPFAAPSPADAAGNAEYVRTQPDADGIEATAAFRGRECRVQVTGWYDTNGNGTLDAGDWVGSSQAMDVVDEGLFGDNSARSPDVMLMTGCRRCS
jgi:hypothetical protein